MTAHEVNIRREMKRCRHFNGTQHPTCDAGVAYTSFPAPLFKTLPCLGPPDAAPCDKRSCPTLEEAEALCAERDRAIEATLSKGRLGICATCDDVSTDWTQSGPCIYSVPCGHRVGQGNARKYKAGVLEARAKEQR